MDLWKNSFLKGHRAVQVAATGRRADPARFSEKSGTEFFSEAHSLRAIPDFPERFCGKITGARLSIPVGARED